MEQLGTVYTDYCLPSLKERFEALGMSITVRDESKWDINYVIRAMTDQYLDVIVIHAVNARAIVEIGIASMFCKKILIVAPVIDSSISQLIDEIQPGCNLYQENTSFLNWCKYTIRGKYAAFLE